MPADSEAPLRLPRTFRPYGVRLVGTALGAMLLLTVGFAWFAFPPEIRSQFTTFQRGTLLFLGLLAFAAWFALVRSRVVAQPGRLLVVNGYRTRVFEWNQVIAVRLPRGAPWAGMDLSDGTSVPVMGIQSSDGARAMAAVRDLRQLIEQLSGG